ncbi:hypothetical protein B0T20DRAFT_390143 [Sordaria brevicollis]|uniref:Kelch repeat-containing protein n=1 Tax=Sordaria brevicollis TaxID=83679 RepID=A0AAE0PLS0_SORBR|nr:hypothetical protein B0T20DRAFT_390143 [Sordaria brevicollis]
MGASLYSLTCDLLLLVQSSYFNLLLLLLLSIAFFPQPTLTQQLDNPPANRLLRRGYSRAIVLGQHVYFDGGEVSQVPDGRTSVGPDPVNSTLSIDISKSWSRSSVEIKAMSKALHGGPVALSDQALWADPSGNAFYVIGGRAPWFRNADKIKKDGIWKFTADGMGSGKWELEEPSNREMLKSINLAEKAAWVTAHGASFGSIAYALGGYTSVATDPDIHGDDDKANYIPSPVAISYDLRTKTLGTLDMAPILGSSTSTLFDGRAIYVPQFGPNGFVFVLGGVKHSSSTGRSNGIAVAGDWLNFNYVTFFDPKTGRWESQVTSGVAPEDRIFFCVVGVAGQAGTYEIFVYGGADRHWTKSFDDLFILSLPGFVWLRADARSSQPRNNHDCVVIGKRQMLVYGGNFFGPKDYLTSKDPWDQGLGIFDLTELAWDAEGKYNASADDYRTPKVVEDWYRTHNNLSSDVPWTTNALKDTFLADAVDFDKKSSSTSTSSSTATASATLNPTNNDSSTSSNVGAIAGGVAGGVAVLVIIAGLIYFFRFKRAKKSSSKPNPAQPIETGEPGVESEAKTLKDKGELPTEPQATELYVPPRELASNHEIWELDASSRTGELDTSNPAYELHAATPVEVKP